MPCTLGRILAWFSRCYCQQCSRLPAASPRSSQIQARLARLQAPPVATTASGGVTVASPANGASVSSPFTLTASAADCSSQAVASMSYALDADAAISVNGTSIDTQVTAAPGSHTVQVTAQGDQGAACDASIVVTVPPPSTPASGGVTITSPANGASVSSPFTLTASAATCSPSLWPR